MSPTKFSIYLACPTKYFWTYLDGRGKFYMRGKSYFSFGSTLHAVLQRFHDSGDQGVTTGLQAVAAMEESWIDAGYSSAQEMQEAMGEGREILAAYISRFERLERPPKTILIEKSLRTPMDGFDLIGRVDRVDEHEDGTLEIVDYKSGRHQVSSEDVASDLAMGIYQLLIRNLFPERPVRATIVALRTGACASSALTDDQAQELSSDLQQLGTHIMSLDWVDHMPSPKPLCGGCDFIPLCHPKGLALSDPDAL